MQHSSDFNLLRQKMCRHRRSLDTAIVIDASRRACDHLAADPAFLQAQVIAIYYPVHGEISPLPLLSSFPEKIFALPITPPITGPLEFYQYKTADKLLPGSFGIPEPRALIKNQILLPQIDLMIVPVVAFDANNHRLGHGAGYYDRTLADSETRPTLIGFAYKWQLVPELPLRPWDVAMDKVVVG